VALFGSRAATLEHVGTEGQVERFGGESADDGGLVEAAPEMTREMQRHGHDEIRRRPIDAAPRTRNQETEEPAIGQFAMELERLHAAIDGPVVAEGRNDETPGRREPRRPLCAAVDGRQQALARGTQVDRAAVGIAAAPRKTQEAGGRQAKVHGRAPPAHDCRPG
jgi:hypothetical protein